MRAPVLIVNFSHSFFIMMAMMVNGAVFCFHLQHGRLSVEVQEVE